MYFFKKKAFKKKVSKLYQQQNRIPSHTVTSSAQQVVLETPKGNSVSVYMQFLTQKLTQISMVQFCFTSRDGSAHKKNSDGTKQS